MEPRGILTMMTDFLEKRLPPSPPRKRKRDTPTPETSNDESSSSESERATKRQRQNDSEGSDDRRSKDAQTPNLQSQRGTKPNLKNRAGNVKPSDSIDEPLKKSSSSSPNITPPPTGLFTRILSPFGLSPRPQKLPKVRRLSEFMEKEEVQELLPRPQTERKPRREVRFNPSTKGGGASNSSLKKVLQRREKHLKYIAPSAAHKNIDNAALSIQANTVGGYRPPHCESVTDEADKILAWESKGDAPFPSLRHPHPSISCPPPLYPSSPSLSHLPPPPPTTGYISNLFSGITGNAPPRASANAANSADKPSISRTVEGSQLTTADLPEGPVPVPLVENSRDTALSTEPRRNEDVNPRHNKFEDNDHTDDDGMYRWNKSTLA